MDWPRETKSISPDFYYVREERGFAFTSTVFEYQFYKRRTWWWDKKLGNVIYRSGTPAEFIDIIYDSLSGFNRVILSKQKDTLLDIYSNFKEEFEKNIGSKY